jgi:hypothetical protein
LVFATVLYAVADAAAALVLVAGITKVWAGAVNNEPRLAAVREALGVGERSWRLMEPVVGFAETMVAGLILTGFAGTIGWTALTIMGACFVLVQLRVRALEIDGDCGCLRLRAGAEKVGNAAVWRAAGVGLGGAAGLIGSLIHSQGTMLARVVALGAGAGAVATLLALGELSTRCAIPRSALWRRRSLAAVKVHPTFRAMADSWRLDGEPYFQRSVGCEDEFRFRGVDDTGTDVTFRLVRMGDTVVSLQSEIERGCAA